MADTFGPIIQEWLNENKANYGDLEQPANITKMKRDLGDHLMRDHGIDEGDLKHLMLRADPMIQDG